MYVIVGANGFLGSYMQKAIREMTDETVLALDVNFAGVKNDDRTTWMQCNITNAEDV